MTAFIHCFLDDSGKESQPSNPYVVMAGYFAEMPIWIELHDKWVALMMKHQISAIHMRDLIPIEGEYKRLGWNVAKRDDVVSEFIDVIAKAPVAGIGIALEIAAWRRLIQRHPELHFGTAQEFCLQRILRRIIDRLTAAGLEGRATIVFDRDPEFSNGRINLFNWIIQNDPRARNLLISITFGDMTYYPGIQCADLLAWETRKDLIQKDSGFEPTRRWKQMFTNMPEYHLDYMGELWNDGEFDKWLPQIIEVFRPSSASSERLS
jgi:hypothetical protein